MDKETVTDFFAASIFVVGVFIGMSTHSVLTPIAIVTLLPLSAYLSFV